MVRRHGVAGESRRLTAVGRGGRVSNFWCKTLKSSIDIEARPLPPLPPRPPLAHPARSALTAATAAAIGCQIRCDDCGERRRQAASDGGRRQAASDGERRQAATAGDGRRRDATRSCPFRRGLCRRHHHRGTTGTTGTTGTSGAIHQPSPSVAANRF